MSSPGVKKIEGWQDSRGKIYPTEAQAQAAEKVICVEAGLFGWAAKQGLRERSQISVDGLIYLIASDWDNFMRYALGITK